MQADSQARVLPLRQLTDIVGNFRLVVWNNRDTFNVQYNAIKVGLYNAFKAIRIPKPFPPLPGERFLYCERVQDHSLS